MNHVAFPSETTSTAPSTTLIAVSSSVAHPGAEGRAAQRSALSIKCSGMVSRSTCGNVTNSTLPRVASQSIVVTATARQIAPWRWAHAAGVRGRTALSGAGTPVNGPQVDH